MRYFDIRNGRVNNELQSQTIDFLRFPLTVLVIYIHSFGEPLIDSPTIDIAIYDNIRIFFSHILSRVAVPTFFVISGYLFFYNVDEFSTTIYRNKLRSRFHTVLVPYVLWNLILILLGLISIISHENESGLLDYFREHGWLNILWSCNEWPFRTSWYGWDITTSGPVLTPIWYLRDLLVAFLLSWVFWKVIKKCGWWIVALISFCNISGLWPNIPGLEIYSICFFLFGSYMAINKINMISCFRKYSKSILVITIILTILMQYYRSDLSLTGQYIYPFFEIFGVMSVFIIGSYLAQSKCILSKAVHMLSETSFFVYALHTILILPLSKNVMQVILPGGNSIAMTFRYLLTPLMCTSICVGVYYVMSYITPGFLRLLTGGRSNGIIKKQNR